MSLAFGPHLTGWPKSHHTPSLADLLVSVSPFWMCTGRARKTRLERGVVSWQASWDGGGPRSLPLANAEHALGQEIAANRKGSAERVRKSLSCPLRAESGFNSILGRRRPRSALAGCPLLRPILIGVFAGLAREGFGCFLASVRNLMGWPNSSSQSLCSRAWVKAA